MVSTIVSTFSRRPAFGYLALVLALISTGVLAFGLWVHHMFATGLPRLGESFFTASSMSIAIPAGIQIFCWLATLWLGRPVYRTPLLFVLAFFFTFVIGGLSGVMVASVPLDTQVHDTYFVVAHFHYVLIGGAVFPLMGAIYYWYPKITGRMMSERLGRWVALLVFVGFNLTFFPMHILGLLGHDPADLHLPGGYGLGRAQPVRQPEFPDPRRRFPAVLRRCHPQRLARGAGGRQSLGCADLGMGDPVAAAQL